MRCLRVLLLCVGASLVAGCRTSLDPFTVAGEKPRERLAHLEPHHPHSIARKVPVPGPQTVPFPVGPGAAWTSPREPDLPRLGREGRERSYWVSGEGEIGTGIERRLDRTQTAGPWEIYPTFTSLFAFGGRMNSGEDAPDRWDNRLRVSFEKPVVNFGRYGATIDYELQNYYFSGMNSFIPGTDRPWNAVHNLELGLNAFQPVHEEWAVIVNGLLGWSAAAGAALAGGFSWSVTFGVGHRVNDDLDLGAGFIVSDRFAEEPFFFGGPQFDWRPSEHWRFQLLGAQLDGAYRPNDDWEWGLTGGFATDRFRLRDEMPQAGRIVTDSRMPIYARLRYRGSDTADVEVRVGAEFLRRIIIEDSRGRNGIQFDADPALFFAVRWIQRFEPPRLRGGLP